MDDFDYMILIGIIYILNCFFLFAINITFCFIHIRESLLHSNFFKVIFIQIILETIVPLFLLLLVLTILISKDNQKWHIIFDTIINYCTNTDIIYNIIILIYLTFKSERKNSDIEENSDSTDLRKSIAFEKVSFKSIHIISLCLGIVHTIIFLLLIDSNFTIQSWGNWFYFFYPIEAKIARIFIFLPYLVLLIMSFPYKFISYDNLEVTNYVHLNHYCINCMIFGIFGIIMPIMKVIAMNVKNSGFPVLIFSSVFFLLYSNCICIFRFNCLYIDNILGSDGKDLTNKIKLFFNLMLFRVDVPKPNFIDFNNTFIYHSLAYESDFSNVDPRQARGSMCNTN